MHRLLSIAGMFLFLARGLHAAEPKPTYPHEVTKWEEVKMPPPKPQGPYVVWMTSANYSHFEWRVFLQDGKPCADLGEGEIPNSGPPFAPRAGKFAEFRAALLVDDGWLVGFNHGEFGAALYWFSKDGKRSYKISGHQVVSFVSLPTGIHAIEGLAHMGLSKGSVIRIAKPKVDAKWEAASIAELPFAPYAVSARRDGSLIIVLSDSLVAVTPDHKIQTLLADAPWGAFYPTSSVLLPDEKCLYLGMRQFVGEFDLTTQKLRLLSPSKAFLNKLPKEDEQRMLDLYGK